MKDVPQPQNPGEVSPYEYALDDPRKPRRGLSPIPPGTVESLLGKEATAVERQAWKRHQQINNFAHRAKKVGPELLRVGFSVVLSTFAVESAIRIFGEKRTTR